ncbi:RhuM family protein [Candidatus Spongiihabitans sp.]|uniref:RhuM family protein n=1 Tax=Candidatus Spongiihabitans sp. TaxID=3101308 RepID=UPI003C7C1590
MENKSIKNTLLYQTKSGQIEFRGDLEHDTVLGNLNHIAELFGRDKSVISRHINNIFQSGELQENATVAKIATVQKEGNRVVTREIDYYNLDMILSVGYRVDSKQATKFRIWATKILKQHLLDGYTINKKRIADNYAQFMDSVGKIQILLPNDGKLDSRNTLELVKAFANVWVSLDAYDTENFPKNGATRRKVKFVAEELMRALATFKKELVNDKQATDLFGRERHHGALIGIIGNVLQSFNGQDVYPSIEEKAANLLYFIVKDHPFTDGNKRSGAFSFIWFLHKARILQKSLTPEALTALTLLVAESAPASKDKMIGLVLLLLRKNR